ncbi:MAG: hypothetical protein M1541_04980 [Acidobacteria bacterium]|nr:hypothetical protein [Acidobacteriota bacterium]
MAGDEGIHENIREILGHLIGQRVADVTQHDKNEFRENGQSYVHLAFEDGSYVKFYIGDEGFSSYQG